MGNTLFMDKKKLSTRKMNGEQKKQIINSPVCNVTHFDGEDDK